MTPQLVSYDVETTGLNPQTNHVIQLSLVKFDSKTFEILDTRSWFIKPEVEFSVEPAAQEVHGFSKEFILENGVSLRSIFPEIVEFFGDCDVLTFNGNTFDNGFLYNDLKELGLELDYNRKFYDSYVIETQRHSRKLTALYKRYTGKELDHAHDALADAMATVEVFKHQLLEDPNINDEDFEMISPEGFVMKQKDEVVFVFGKYARKNVVTVCEEDPSYIKWVFENCSQCTKNTIMSEYRKVHPKEQK